MKQIIFGRMFNNSQAAQNPSYLGFFALGGNGAVHNQQPWSVAGTFRNWRIDLHHNSSPTIPEGPGTGHTIVFTLQKNSVDTALTITIAGTAISGEDLTHSVSVAVGDVLRVKCQYTVGSSGVQKLLQTYIEFDADNARESGYNGTGGAPSGTWATVTTQRASLGLNFSGWFNAVDDGTGGKDPLNYEDLWPLAGEITRYDVIYRSGTTGAAQTPGAGKGFAFVLYKNGVKQDGTGGTVDTTCSLTDAASVTSWAGSLPIAVGDVVFLEETSTGSPSAFELTTSCRFKATTDNHFALWTRKSPGAVVDGAPLYTLPGISGPGATEANTLSNEPVSDFWLIGLHSRYGPSSPSASDYTYSIRKNQTTPGGTPSVFVEDVAVGGQPANYVIVTMELSTVTAAGLKFTADTDVWDIRIEAGEVSFNQCVGGGAITVVADPPDGEDFEGRVVELRFWATIRWDDQERSVALDTYNHLPAYGGRKVGLVTTVGDIVTQLSDRFASYKMGQCTLSVDDRKRILATLETATGSQYWFHREVSFHCASPATIAANGTPHTLFRGIWKGYGNQGFDALLTFEDILGSGFSDFNLEAKIPSELIEDTLLDVLDLEETSIPLGVGKKVVPIGYGHISDQSVTTKEVGTIIPQDSSYLPINTAGCADVKDGVGDIDGPVGFIVCGVKSGLMSPISNPAGTTDYARAIRGGWNSDPFYDSYVIFFWGGDAAWLDWTPQGGVKPGARVDWVRMFTHDQTPDTADPWFPKEMYIQIEHITDGDDALTGVTTVSVDNGKGKVSPRYLGIRTLSDGPNHTWLLCGHAPTDIEEGYVYEVPLNLGTDSSAEADWKFPGYPSYIAEFGTTPYEVFDSKAYCLIYGLVGRLGPDRAAGLATIPDMPPGIIPFTVNFCGVEDVGDSTGFTITSPPRIAYHLIDKWLLQTPTAGSWPAPKTSLDGIPWLNSASFAALEPIEELRVAPDGYEGFLYLDEPILVRELLGNIQQAWDIYFGQNQHGQVIAKHLDDFTSLTGLRRLTDVQEIGLETEIDRSLEQLENLIEYDFDWRPAAGLFEQAENIIEDATAITANRDRVAQGERRLLYYTGDADTALDVMGRKLAIGKYPLRNYTVTGPIHWITVRIGQYVLLTDEQGIGPTGVTDLPLWIVGKRIRFGTLDTAPQVLLTGVDIERFLTTSGVMAPDSVPDWGSASADEKLLYGFMSDDDGLMPDGAPGKEMR